MSKLVSLLAEPIHGAYAELCPELGNHGFSLTIEELDDWKLGQELLESRQVEYAAICGLLYTLLRARGLPLKPIAAPLLTSGRQGVEPLYYCDIVVRKNAPFRNLDELTQATFLYNEAGSFSGYRALLGHLGDLGKGPDFLGDCVETGSHLESLRRLSEGEGDYCIIDSSILDFQSPEKRQALRVLESLGPYPAPLLVSFGDGSELLEACQNLEKLPQPFKSFVPVKDEDYNPIRKVWNSSLALVPERREQAFVCPEKGCPEHSFTQQKQRMKDHQILCGIGQEVLQQRGKEPTSVLSSGPKFYLHQENDLERHHYLIAPQELEKGDLAIVGFLSQMKPGVNLKALFDVDADLLQQLSSYEGFLTYSPTEYEPGLWANLAVFRSAEARDNWAKNSTHLQAIRELGPSSYDNVRLHLGVWPAVSGSMNWLATRYLHYGEEGLWRGVCTP